MIQWLKRINAILLQLIGLVMLHAILVEFIGVWFVADKLHYSLGVLTGLVLAIFMLVHMAVVIEDSLLVMDRRGKIWVSMKGIFRYIIIAGVVIAMVYVQWGSYISCFITILGVKMAAYAHPFLNKKIHNKKSKEVNK